LFRQLIFLFRRRGEYQVQVGSINITIKKLHIAFVSHGEGKTGTE